VRGDARQGRNKNGRRIRRPRVCAEKDRTLSSHFPGDRRRPSGEGAAHGPIRIPLPSHNFLCPIHEECGEAANPVPQHHPEAAQGLGIHDPNHHLLAVDLSRVSNPLRPAEVFRLQVLRVLVVFLRVDPLPHPRKGTGHLWGANWLISLELLLDSWGAGFGTGRG